MNSAKTYTIISPSIIFAVWEMSVHGNFFNTYKAQKFLAGSGWQIGIGGTTVSGSLHEEEGDIFDTVEGDTPFTLEAERPSIVFLVKPVISKCLRQIFGKFMCIGIFLFWRQIFTINIRLNDKAEISHHGVLFFIYFRTVRRICLSWHFLFVTGCYVTNNSKK